MQCIPFNWWIKSVLFNYVQRQTGFNKKIKCNPETGSSR